MVIAALISFGILLLAWILAPERSTHQPRSQPQLDRLALERN
jgi:hypothetical protein